MKDSILSIKYKNNTVYIDLKIKNIPVTTRDLPATLTVLKKEIPSIFTNKCFNDAGLSFYKEVQNTETAHLLEHLILEEMCLTKLQNAKSAVFEGKTIWNKANTDNKYQIRLSVSLFDLPIFASALTKSVSLVEQIALTKAQTQLF